MIRPDLCMQFLRPGRLIHIKDGEVDWSWGVLVRPRREAPAVKANPSLGPGGQQGMQHVYTLDVLLLCSPSSSQSEEFPNFFLLGVCCYVFGWGRGGGEMKTFNTLEILLLCQRLCLHGGMTHSICIGVVLAVGGCRWQGRERCMDA